MGADNKIVEEKRVIHKLHFFPILFSNNDVGSWTHKIFSKVTVHSYTHIHSMSVPTLIFIILLTYFIHRYLHRSCLQRYMCVHVYLIIWSYQKTLLVWLISFKVIWSLSSRLPLAFHLHWLKILFYFIYSLKIKCYELAIF